jgi:hypothetical protein
MKKCKRREIHDDRNRERCSALNIAMWYRVHAVEARVTMSHAAAPSAAISVAMTTNVGERIPRTVPNTSNASARQSRILVPSSLLDRGMFPRQDETIDRTPYKRNSILRRPAKALAQPDLGNLAVSAEFSLPANSC